MYEVCKSATAIRLGINNIPSEEILEKAYEVARHILQPVRDKFGPIAPTSWYRCEELEKVITERHFTKWCEEREYSELDDYAWQEYYESKSHPKGEAVDFEKYGVRNGYMFNWCKDNFKNYDQLIAEFMNSNDPSAGWIHASYNNNNRMQLININ